MTPAADRTRSLRRRAGSRRNKRLRNVAPTKPAAEAIADLVLLDLELRGHIPVGES